VASNENRYRLRGNLACRVERRYGARKNATVVADACAGLSIKAAVAVKLDCTATGAAVSPQADSSSPKPRLGCDTSPWLPSCVL
jgi:hypothetical protein